MIHFSTLLLKYFFSVQASICTISVVALLTAWRFYNFTHVVGVADFTQGKKQKREFVRFEDERLVAPSLPDLQVRSTTRGGPGAEPGAGVLGLVY